MLEAFVGFTFSRALLAAVFIFATTADDAVWLVSVLHGKSKLIHAFTFILTLQMACIGSWVVCISFSNGLISMSSSVEEHYEDWFQLFAIAITWGIALYLFLKKMLKICRKRYQDSERVELAVITNLPRYEAITESPPITGASFVTNSFSAVLEEKDESKVAFVISMTLTGALDEIVCFPSLMMAGTFTIQELLVGCFLASAVIVIIVYYILDSCKCLLNILDSIPLFVVVAFIATIQTVTYAAHKESEDS
jgi:hypothetical protein